MVIAQVKALHPTQFVPARLAHVSRDPGGRRRCRPREWQCAVSEDHPAISGEFPHQGEVTSPDVPRGLRGIVAPRAARELREGASVNFGFGIPGGIPGVLAEQNRSGTYWGSVEQGIHNGELMDGAMFGAARHPQAIVSSVDQFDFYSGGGVDLAFVGMGEWTATAT